MSNNWCINDDTLAHHGIKGQKLGIRRYQNDDGTLTEEGKKRYAELDSKFKQNVYAHEYAIAIANYNNLSEKRDYFDDDDFSKKMRKQSVKLKKDGEKMLKELFDSGYYQSKYGFDPKKVDYNTFKSAVEKEAYRQGSLQLYGRKLDEVEYELAILAYTKPAFDFSNKSNK